MEDITKYGHGASVIIVGNKIDLIGTKTERTVSYDEAKQMAIELGVDYLETSAKDGSSVDKAFQTVINKAARGYIIH